MRRHRLGFAIWIGATSMHVTVSPAQSAPREPAAAFTSDLSLTPSSPESRLDKGAWTVGWELAPGWGTHGIGGSRKSHDLFLTGVQAGRIVTGRLGEDCWLGGHLELNGLIFGGFQYRPDNAYLTGLNPGLRYYFDTGTRWAPYFGGSAGVLVTDIGKPDLAGTFQFNEQVGAGLLCFVRDDLAVHLGYRFLHVSNAGIREPNVGVNSHLAIVGLNWMF